MSKKLKKDKKTMVCAGCGTTFAVPRGRPAARCKACRAKSEEAKKKPTAKTICANCKKEFNAKRKWARFCGTPCRNAYWNSKNEKKKDTTSTPTATGKAAPS